MEIWESIGCVVILKSARSAQYVEGVGAAISICIIQAPK
jgi:hypothetical protein